MPHNFWLLAVLVLLSPELIQGHDLCYDDSWSYDHQSFSCFKGIDTLLTWTQARHHCLQIPVGKTFGVTTRLAKIDTNHINLFIRDVCRDLNPMCWIGFSYNADKGAYRWDGSPDEEPSFLPRMTDWTLPYIAMSHTGGWHDDDETRTLPFICQHVGKTIGDVTCLYHVIPNGLRVTCTSQKSPIKAACQWSYKYEGDANFRDLDTVEEPNHESDTGDNSYTTSCTATLTNVNPRKVTFEVQMYADVTVATPLTNFENAVTVGNITIDIVPPDRPVFKLLNKTLQTSSPIHFSEDDRIYLTCEVPTGNPSVHSVTLACPFSFNINNAAIGRVYVMDQIASRDMNGKSCTCIGNHVTGDIQSSPLTFNITYPSEVKDFTVNGQPSLLVVDLYESLTFSCLADGNPLPSVNIRKLGTSYVDTSDWLSSNGRLEKEIQAQCEHNGRYRCSAQNSEQDHQANDSVDVDIRVRCRPTYCNQLSRELGLGVRLGGPEAVSLCVVAYPVRPFTLLKNSETGWQASEDPSINTTHVTSNDFQQIVTITLANVGPTHLGEYALGYHVGNNSYVTSSIYFNLTASLTPCNGQESVDYEVKLGQPVSIHLCVTAFPSPAALALQKAMDSSWHDYGNTNVMISMNLDFDTLTSVRIVFLEINAMDVGEYRLFDPQQVNGADTSYLRFRLSDIKPKCPACSSSLSTGAIIGLILASDVVVVILTIIIMKAFRKLRTSHHRKTSGNGCTNGGFHKPEPEGNYSGYVDVNETAMMPGKTVWVPSPRSVPEKTIYEGEELQARENTEYETVRDIEDGEKEGTKKGYYNILHPDDPNYTNLNQEPSRQYVTIDPRDQAPRSVYHVPKSTA